MPKTDTDKPAGDKPYCEGRFTEAKQRSLVIGALRRIKWPVKYMVLQGANTHSEVNPDTGRSRKMYKCADCCCSFPAKEVNVDHIDPVMPLGGSWGDTTEYCGVNWNEAIPRLLCDSDGLQVLCGGCHDHKSAIERKARKVLKDQKEV